MGSCQSIQTSDGKSGSKQKGKPQIIVKTFTWGRDSHGLFDYESKTLSKKNMKSQFPGKIIRKGNDILLNKENDQTNPQTDRELIKLNIHDGNYWVSSCVESVKKGIYEDDHEDNQNSMWLVVKSFKPAGGPKPGYKLNEGDLLKLGRIKFRIKELRSSGASPGSKKYNPGTPEKHMKTEEDSPNNPNNESRRNSKCSNAEAAASRTSTAQVCRICLGENCDAEDPFFSPCHCAGTMKYIHVLCLQRWLKSKLHTKSTGFSTSVYWKTLECELCKKTFPTSFEIDGKKYDIIEIERPDCGYLMMEILSKEKNILRGIHIIKMEGKSNIKLGRGHDSDIRITDISVSRCHAVIKLDKGNFYIEDNNSKFGTLVHLKKPFPLLGDYNNISLQIGRTVVSLNAKKNWKSFGCFGTGGVSQPEIEDDIFGGRGVTVNTEVNAINSRHPSHMENEPNMEHFDENGVRDERDLPSPINQGGEEPVLDDDGLSHSGDEDFPEDNIPENPDQINVVAEGPVIHNQPPGGQQANAQVQEEIRVENLEPHGVENQQNQVAALAN